jgi:sec-independent protein translocase protein TatA
MALKIGAARRFHQLFRRGFGPTGKRCYIGGVPGLGEWIVILLIVLVVFGANKLPSIGDALGRSIKNFKRAAAGDEDKGDDDDEPAPKKSKKQLATKQSKQLEEASEEGGEDDEWEEVVVRRRKKKDGASKAAEG